MLKSLTRTSSDPSLKDPLLKPQKGTKPVHRDSVISGSFSSADSHDVVLDMPAEDSRVYIPPTLGAREKDLHLDAPHDILHEVIQYNTLKEFILAMESGTLTKIPEDHLPILMEMVTKNSLNSDKYPRAIENALKEFGSYVEVYLNRPDLRREDQTDVFDGKENEFFAKHPVLRNPSIVKAIEKKEIESRTALKMDAEEIRTVERHFGRRIGEDEYEIHNKIQATALSTFPKAALVTTISGVTTYYFADPASVMVTTLGGCAMFGCIFFGTVTYFDKKKIEDIWAAADASYQSFLVTLQTKPTDDEAFESPV